MTTPKASKKCRELVWWAHLKFTLETKLSLQENIFASIAQEGERRKKGGGRQEGGEEGGVVFPAPLSQAPTFKRLHLRPELLLPCAHALCTYQRENGQMPTRRKKGNFVKVTRKTKWLVSQTLLQ